MPCVTGWGCGAQEQGPASCGHRLSWRPGPCVLTLPPLPKTSCAVGSRLMVGLVSLVLTWPSTCRTWLCNHIKGLASFLVIFCSSARNSPTAMSFDPYLLSSSLMWASLYQRPWGISRPFPTNHFWTYTHRGERGVFGSIWFNPVGNFSRICPKY